MKNDATEDNSMAVLETNAMSRQLAHTQPLRRQKQYITELQHPGHNSSSTWPFLPSERSFSMSFVYALFSLPAPFLLKSSNCLKFLRFAISFPRAGGYCPTQYQLPGASQTRLAGSATQAFDSFDTFRTLKIRIRPYL